MTHRVFGLGPLLARLAGLALVMFAAPAWAQAPRAETPTYKIGDKWFTTDGTYRLVRIDDDTYVFSAGPGRAIHLTKNLATQKIVHRGSVIVDVWPTADLEWPLKVGAWGQRPAVITGELTRVNAGGGYGPGLGWVVTWRVEEQEQVTVAGGSFNAFRIRQAFGMNQVAEIVMWYAPEVRQIVKVAYGGRFARLAGPGFELALIEKRAPPVVASPTPAPPSVTQPTPAPPVVVPPAVRVPPTIALLDPRPGVLVRTDHAALKIEVKSENLLKSLVVKGLGQDKTFVPEPGAKAGAPWTIETTVPLAEGANVVRLEAVDEFGSRAAETVVLARQSLIAVQFEGPAGATVRVDQDRHVLDAQGKLALRLAPGTYQVEATKEGLIPTREPLRLAPGQGTVVHKLALVQAVPPTIALLDPKPGAVLRTADVTLKVEVKSRYRLSALRVGKENESAQQTFAPSATAKPGETWTVAALVLLSEGDNTLTLEASDEHGTRARQTVTLTRQSLVALDVRGPPGAEVRVNRARYTLDAQGALTLQVAPGTYQIDASKEGFTSIRDTVTVPPGQATQRRLVLAPLPPPPPAPRIATPPVDTEAPTIAINYPPPDTKVEWDSIVITGLVTDNVGVDRVQIAVNGVGVAQSRDIGVVGRGVPIRVPMALQPGNNLIEITAADKAGNVAQVVRTVLRVAPATAAIPAPKIVNRWAVVIGVGHYENRQIPGLRYATRDAEAMYTFLTTQGGYAKERTLLLTDSTQEKPTLVNIKRALGDFLSRRAGRDDMVLIYFAGHGAPEVDVSGAETDGLSKYLVPRDGNPDSLYSTALPMDDVQRIFGRIAAERIVMLLDTCYSGTAGGRTFARARVRAGGINDQFLERLTRSRGRVILTASGPNEVALESATLAHGLFTYYLLEGLKGKADRNGDGIVTVSELYEYVEEQVDRAARLAGGRQRPLMRGEIEGTLPLSKAAR